MTLTVVCGALRREALRAYASTIDEDLRLLGDTAELPPGSVEHMAVLVRPAVCLVPGCP